MRVILFLCGGIFITSFILTMVSYAFLFSFPEDYKILDVLKDNLRALLFLAHFPSILIMAVTAGSIAWSSKAQDAYQRVKHIKKNANLFWFVTGSSICMVCFIVFYMAMVAGYFLPKHLNLEISLKYLIISGAVAGLLIKITPSTIIRTIDRVFRKYFYREKYLYLHFPSSRLGLLYLAYKYRHIDRFPHGPKYLWHDQVNLLAYKAKKGDDSAIEHLLCWLKDMNWPGAGEACRNLLSWEERSIPAVTRILKSDDVMWKRWVVNSLVSDWSEQAASEISPLLLELARRDDTDKINIGAAWILCMDELCSKDELQEILGRLKTLYPDDVYEIEEIEDCLSDESSENQMDDSGEWD